MSVRARGLASRFPEQLPPGGRAPKDPADYYAAIRSDPVTRLVKECDIADNSDPRRPARLPLDVQETLVKKYTTAYTLLGLNPEKVALPNEG